MKNKYINKIAFLGLVGVLFTANSCVQDDDYNAPPIECSDIASNFTIKQVTDLVNASTDQNKLVSFAPGTILEAYVISSDETGNFYKTISLQDSPENPTVGIQIELDANSTYIKYPLNSKILIDLSKLYAALDRGTIKIGARLAGSTFTIDRMPEALMAETMTRSCDPAVTLVPKEYNNISDALNEGNLNTLVKINNVQFLQPEVDGTYSNEQGGGAVNRKLVDKTGRTLDLRNSDFATFGQNPLPTGSGSITVVVSRYNSTYQVFIRDINDVNFDQPRFGDDDDDNGGGDEGGDGTEAANLLFNGADFENWTTFLSSLNGYGLTDGLAVQGVGNGYDGSNSFHLNGTTEGNNPFVFTVKAESAQIPDSPKKITFWVKGSAAKSLSFNLDTDSGRKFYNLGAFSSENLTVNPAENNQYVGAVDTNNEWVLVTLNIEGLQLNKTGDLLAMKAGSGTTYDLIIDNIKID